MTAHVRKLVCDLVLDNLDEVQAEQVCDHLARCPVCAAERDAFERVTSELARALPPVEPGAELRDRLLSTVASARRFADYDQPLAEHFDLPEARARELVDRIDDSQAWKAGPFPGVSLISVDPGPAYEGWVAAIMKVPAGARFPWHRHAGTEVVLVLQGGCIDSDGVEYRAGCRPIDYPPGSAHDFIVPADGPSFVFAARSQGFVIEPRPD